MFFAKNDAFVFCPLFLYSNIYYPLSVLGCCLVSGKDVGILPCTLCLIVVVTAAVTAAVVVVLIMP